MSEVSQLIQIDLRSSQITKLSWSPCGRFLAIPTDSGAIEIFELESGQIRTFGRYSHPISAIGWDFNSELILTGSVDGSITLWERETGRMSRPKFSGHEDPIHSIEWTDEGGFAITCSRNRICALDGCCLLPAWTEPTEQAVNQHKDFTVASCSRRTTLVVALAAENGTLLVFVSLLSGEVLGSIPMEQPIRSLAWSPEDDILMAGTSGGILAFSANHEGIRKNPRRLTKAEVHTLAFSGDGTVVASVENAGLNIRDATSAYLIHSMVGEHVSSIAGWPVRSLAFHPTKPLLATAISNGSACSVLDLGKLM